MEDILLAFERDGWSFVDASDSAGAPAPDGFTLDGAKVIWRLGRADGAILEFEFEAFGDLGQETSRLSDIFHCLHKSSGQKLMFHKRQTKEWRDALRRFVHGVLDLPRA